MKDILLSNPDGLRDVIRVVMQEVLEAEMDEALGAGKGERTPERLGYRSGSYGRTEAITEELCGSCPCSTFSCGESHWN